MKYLLTIFTLVLFFTAGAQPPPPGYYAPANGISGGTPLLTALKNIIDAHTVMLYSDLELYYPQTDKKANAKVWDMYSFSFTGTQPYEFSFVVDQCGNYSAEGDCFNKEHLWPQSLFNNAGDVRSDLHQVPPTDGWVNNKRANFPFGDVTSTTWTSLNGSKLGTGSTYAGYTGLMFEPIDSFKGDIARSIMYVACRYSGEDGSWQNWQMANKAVLTADAKKLLLAWHHLDPVSTKELNRNDAVFAIQKNRNPFIDNPKYADCIWGDSTCSAIPNNINEINLQKIGIAQEGHNLKMLLPENETDVQVTCFDILGQRQTLNGNQLIFSTEYLNSGIHVLRIIGKHKQYFATFIK
jgi:endonuclease I